MLLPSTHRPDIVNPDRTIRRLSQRKRRAYRKSRRTNNDTDLAQKCDSSGVASLKKDNNTVVDARGKAEVLNSQFSSVFTEGGDSPLPDLGTSSTPDVPKINGNGVMKLFRGLKPHKVTRPDDVLTVPQGDGITHQTSSDTHLPSLTRTRPDSLRVEDSQCCPNLQKGR